MSKPCYNHRVYTPAMRAQFARSRKETRHEGSASPRHGTAGSADGDPAAVYGLRQFSADLARAPDYRKGGSTATGSAAEILRTAADVIEQRAQLRDLPNGERSMLRAVTAYNALTGATLSELDGWTFMCILKLARATAGKPHLDDFTDLAGYAALAGEGITK